MILIVGEAFGKEEHKMGRPFVGKCGTYLRRFINETGLAEQVRYTNICNFWPNKDLKTRRPTKSEIEKGATLVYKHIEETRPSLIIGLGQVALSGLIHPGLKLTDNRGIRRVLGYAGAPEDRPGYLAFTYHPSYALRFNKQAAMEEDLLNFFNQCRETWSSTNEIRGKDNGKANQTQNT